MPAIHDLGSPAGSASPAHTAAPMSGAVASVGRSAAAASVPSNTEDTTRARVSMSGRVPAARSSWLRCRRTHNASPSSTTLRLARRERASAQRSGASRMPTSRPSHSSAVSGSSARWCSAVASRSFSPRQSAWGHDVWRSASVAATSGSRAVPPRNVAGLSARSESSSARHAKSNPKWEQSNLV